MNWAVVNRVNQIFYKECFTPSVSVINCWIAVVFLCIVCKSVISLFSVQREALCHLAQLDSATTDFPVSQMDPLSGLYLSDLNYSELP